MADTVYNENKIQKIGLGGGCHWCTEAVFASLKGVTKVEQGWIASEPPFDAFSEAVVVTYDTSFMSVTDLIDIHLHTHASTARHSMRHKYRSAIYVFDENQEANITAVLHSLQAHFEKPIITQVLPFIAFRLSLPEHLDYYYANPEKPFCRLYIDPKLQLLKERYKRFTKDDR